MSYKRHFLKFWNLWPPFLFTGIKMIKVAPDYRNVVVRLKLRFWNANYVGTQYGGAMFSMTDPFYMVMLMHNLGPDYVIWDKAASIKYIKPGRSDVFAEFNVTEEEIREIKNVLEQQKSMDWNRTVEIKDANGAVIARVEKVIYLSKRCKKEGTC